jgi:hypothetical protein
MDAISAAQETGAGDRLVHPQELHGDFMRAPAPSWIAGLGSHLRVAFAICAVAGLAAMILAGRLPPVIVGIAVLFAIGLRRILIATALLLSLFAATSVVSSPPGQSSHEHASQLSARSHSHAAPARAR